jgi:MipA family protein
MIRMRQAAACVAFLGLSLPFAQAADLMGGYPVSTKDGVGGYWVVTLGGYVATEPRFPGSKDNTVTFRPIVDVHRAGDRDWINLPNDASNLTLVEGANWRAGVAGDYLNDRNHESALRGLHDINYTLELGGFAEYYPAPFLRTRIELLQGVTGAEGLAANLSADAIFRPDPQWLFTVGPRLKVVNTQYQSTFFSVNGVESLASGLPAYHASGGLNSAGVDATARYYVNERLSVRAFAEWNRLVGDAADSPIVRLRGSENQWQAGIGASYTFNYAY